MYYRIIDETAEPMEQELDSRVQSAGSARKKRASALYKQFGFIYAFAEKHQIKLDQAAAIAVNPEVYIPVIRNAHRSGLSAIALSDIGCFMPGDIALQELVTYMGQYQNLCSQADTWIRDKGSDQSYMQDYVWEAVRRRISAALPSRFESVFLFDDYFLAEKYNDQLYDNTGAIAEVEIVTRRGFCKSDMEWFLGFSTGTTVDQAADVARRYWRGIGSDEPVWEYLLDGTYILHAAIP